MRFTNCLQLMYAEERKVMTELHIYHGRTGTGKSHRAFTENPGAYYKDVTSTWWDGYEEHPCVIIEDFRGQIALDTFLRLVDKYPLRVQVKGGYRQFTSAKIVVTSNLHPDQWWNDQQKGYAASYAAFKRRITNLEEMDVPYAVDPLGPM